MEGGAGMSVGIVSLWWNTPELLNEWERLLAPGGWDRAILVDNASDETSRAAYAESAERMGFEILRMEENDVVKGWNAGMDALDADVKVCMASDVISVHHNWLIEVIRWVGPGIIAGPFPRRFVDGTRYLDGSTIAYHSIDWERLGGLDEGYVHPGYVSDVDICWRAVQLGIVLHQCAPVLVHLENYTTKVGKGRIHPTWPGNRDRFLAKKKEAEGG